MELANIFYQKYIQNSWKSKESVSGTGSELEITKVLREGLKTLVDKYNIKSMLDAPCGDFNWMKEFDLSNIEYIGADIIYQLIEENKNKYGLDFRVLDVTNDILPKVDLILVRDCLVHLSNENIFNFLTNLKNSKIKYLLVTSFTDKDLGHEWRKSVINSDIPNGGWRPINLEDAPFNIKSPLDVINENCTEDYPNYTDKSLLLYDVEKLTWG